MDYSCNSAFVEKLDSDLYGFIQNGLTGANDELFNELALREFAVQFHNIEYYKKLCLEKGISPATVKAWQEIPAVPSADFKKMVLAAFPLHETELALMTSGTSNPANPGKIYRDKRCVEMYFLANRIMTKEYLFPDIEKMRILLMVPSPKVAPAMGMATGLEQMRQYFGTEDSRYLISPEGMEWEQLFAALQESEESCRPVAIVGATSGFVYMFNFFRDQGLKFSLPPDSRICDGGGYMGTFGECSREEYLSMCSEFLGVPPELCVNTLGTVESATNYFDNILRNHSLGSKGVPRFKECPPWTRTIVVHPQTGERLERGQIGILRHYDLVNRANVMVVQTDNLGYETAGGFEIIGRADIKGTAAGTALHSMISGQTCATTAEKMLHEQSEGSTTAANEMLDNSPHGKMFDHLPQERLEKLKKMCPFLRLQGLLKKKE